MSFEPTTSSFALAAGTPIRTACKRGPLRPGSERAGPSASSGTSTTWPGCASRPWSHCGQAKRRCSIRSIGFSGWSLAPRLDIAPAGLILLDGVYSGAPELADLIDRAVFVQTPETERLRRLRTLVAPEDWDNEWLQAEKSYFTGVRPPRSFDLVVPGTGALAPAPATPAPAEPRRTGGIDKAANRP